GRGDHRSDRCVRAAAGSRRGARPAREAGRAQAAVFLYRSRRRVGRGEGGAGAGRPAPPRQKRRAVRRVPARGSRCGQARGYLPPARGAPDPDPRRTAQVTTALMRTALQRTAVIVALLLAAACATQHPAYLKGQDLLAAGQWEEAIAQLDTAAKENPRQFE